MVGPRGRRLPVQTLIEYSPPGIEATEGVTKIYVLILLLCLVKIIIFIEFLGKNICLVLRTICVDCSPVYLR